LSLVQKAGVEIAVLGHVVPGQKTPQTNPVGEVHEDDVTAGPFNHLRAVPDTAAGGIT
jgi:hypothetical protein